VVDKNFKIWVKSDGNVMTIRKVSDPVMFLSCREKGSPLPIQNDILDPDAARDLVEALKGSKRYDVEIC